MEAYRCDRLGEVTLRDAVTADADALAELGARAFVAKFGPMYSPQNLAGFLAATHAPGPVAAEIAHPSMCIRVAEIGGRLAAFCKLKLACGWPEHRQGAHAVELKQLYTDPDLTGRGLGADLTRWALAKARAVGADEMQLSVWSGNTDAQRFYARFGFRKVADIDFHVGDQRDEEFLFAAML